MNKLEGTQFFGKRVHTSEHFHKFQSCSIQELPHLAIPFHCIKLLELELSRRGLIDCSRLNSHPLWFVAETERNTFLWRNGLSIADSDQFDFWVDIPTLTKKRLKQLDNFEPTNIFHAAFWGNDPVESDASLDQERLYLFQLQEYCEIFAPHVKALAAALKEEGIGTFEFKPLALLPRL